MGAVLGLQTKNIQPSPLTVSSTGSELSNELVVANDVPDIRIIEKNTVVLIIPIVGTPCCVLLYS